MLIMAPSCYVGPSLAFVATAAAVWQDAAAVAATTNRSKNYNNITHRHTNQENGS